MKELLTELENAMDSTEAETGGDEQGSGQPNPQAGEENASNDVTNEELWTQTNEYKQGLWKSPDDVYNSVKHYREKYSPIEQIQKSLKFNSPDELREALTSYKEQMPVYEKSMNMLQHLNALIKDPVHGQTLQKAISEIQAAQEREKYGLSLNELPQEFKEQLTAGVQAKEMLEKIQEEQQVQELTSEIDGQIQGLQTICSKYGMNLDVQGFLTHCAEKQIPAKFIKGYFMENYFDTLINSASTSASLSAVNKNKEVKGASIASSQKQSAKMSDDIPSDKQGLMNKLLSTL